MKYILRIPTKEQYAYIEAEYEGDADGAVAAYQELTRAVQGGTGVGMKMLASIIINLVKHAAIPGGGDYDFSTNESLLLKEITKQIRTNNK